MPYCSTVILLVEVVDMAVLLHVDDLGLGRGLRVLALRILTLRRRRIVGHLVWRLRVHRLTRLWLVRLLIRKRLILVCAAILRSACVIWIPLHFYYY